MTGEMYKPEYAELDREHWTGKKGCLGYSLIGDDGVCIKPNYPVHFELAEFLSEQDFIAEVKPFDVYQGPYIYVSIPDKGGYKIWSIEPGEIEDNIWIIEHAGEFSDSMLFDGVLDYLNRVIGV